MTRQESDNMQSSVRVLKIALRKQMRQQLRAVTQETILLETERVAEKLFQLPEYKNSHKVSIYLNMGGEIRTDGIIKHLLNNGKQCFIPRCHGDVMEMVRLHSLEDYQSLPLNSWGIPEPAWDEPREDAFAAGGLDLIIMPGLAFDRQCNRLGHGKGYYDRYVAACDQFAEQHHIRPPHKIALALSAQILTQELPHEPFDRRPDYVLTHDETLQP